MNKARSVALLAGLALAGASFLPGAGPARIDARRIRDHVRTLSSDAMEGRGMGQKGSDLAADYIAKELRAYGLEPAGEAGSYFQKVPMVGVTTLPETAFALESEGGGTLALKNLDDFAVSNESQTELEEFTAPVVFVGFGIKAPEYGWDDYKDCDLRGKVALLFVNEPPSEDPGFFKGRALTYYGRWIYKFEETARRGAVATLIIHRTDLASYGWEVVRNSLGTDRSYLKRDGTPKLKAASWVQLEAARKIVAAGGYDLDDLYRKAQAKEFRPIELPVKLKARVASRLRAFDSRNVLAKVGGASEAGKAEAVLYTAHYDHLGINPALQGDQIFNGAVDNATGCGLLLELARVAAGERAQKPRRSLYFAFVTAEEQGLLGSEYLGKHPPVPAGRISLDLNFDALAPLGEPQWIEVSGAERTTIYPTVQELARRAGFAIQTDDKPEAGHYYRSDHFSLARVGVPAFSIGEGVQFVGHDVAWGRLQSEDYLKNRYHQPGDEYRKDWDFRGLAKIAAFGYELGLAAANQTALVEWNPGDEFEGARRRSLAAAPGEPRSFAAFPQLRLLECGPPAYPPLAAATRTAGTVTVHLRVGRAGNVEAAEATRGHPILFPAAVDYVRALQFRSVDNPVEIDLRIRFSLSERRGSRLQATFDRPGEIAIESPQPDPDVQFSVATRPR